MWSIFEQNFNMLLLHNRYVKQNKNLYFVVSIIRIDNERTQDKIENLTYSIYVEFDAYK